MKKINYDNNVEYVWVEGRYSGGVAKQIKALADDGTAYFELGAGSVNKELFVDVAFPMALAGSPIPEHLTKITDPYKIAKLQRKRCVRQGIHKSIEDVCPSCGVVDKKQPLNIPGGW